MLEVRLSAVRVDVQSRTPVVVLQEIGGARALPIFIGVPEATAIAFALQSVSVPRPMTHDLLKDVIDALGATLERVVITEVRDTTYYAELHLDIGGRLIDVSSRPSDAIALAARTNSPLYVEESLMDNAGVIIEVDEDGEGSSENPEELVGQFREFLDEVRPEDFRS